MRRNDLRILRETAHKLPADVITAFEGLGDLQRGKPEMAMLRVQHIMGGGVLSPVVEHVGDITHRMSHMVKYNTVLGRDKIHKTLGWLTNPYGFEREMRENIRSNARYRGVPEDQLRQQLHHALHSYAAAHAQLPVYNRAQWLARQAAVYVGLEDFDNARKALQRLAEMSSSEDEFATYAMQYTKDPDGHLLQFVPGREMA
jgi:hypothetical protein